MGIHIECDNHVSHCTPAADATSAPPSRSDRWDQGISELFVFVAIDQHIKARIDCEHQGWHHNDQLDPNMPIVVAVLCVSLVT